MTLSSGLLNSRLPEGHGSDDGERMTIGGQLSILEVMLQEQERQEADWLDEQQCAHRLLLTTSTQQPVPDPELARAARNRAILRDGARVARQRPASASATSK